MADTTKKPTLELLLRVFECVAESDPWYEDDYGREWCFFCTSDGWNKVHEKDCIWVEAQKFRDDPKEAT